MHDLAETRPKRSIGCLWLVAAVAVIFGWLAALCALVSVAVSLFGPSYSYISPQLRSLLASPLGSVLSFLLPGTLGFAGIVTLLPAAYILHYLPRSAWW